MNFFFIELFIKAGIFGEKINHLLNIKQYAYPDLKLLVQNYYELLGTKFINTLRILPEKYKGSQSSTVFD